MATLTPASSPDMSVAIKVVLAGKDENRKFKLPLKELGANSLPDKLRSLLDIPSSQKTTFERFSDSSSSYVTLDSSIPSVYKQLYRAAKAKQKLKIRVTIVEKEPTKPIEVPKLEAALPERLSTRRYVSPYISDPVKFEEETKEDTMTVMSGKVPPLVNELGNRSSATLVAPSKASMETPREISASSISSPNKSYYWPVSQNSTFSGATKSVFEKKDAENKDSAAKKATEDEAPVPRFFTDREDFHAQYANATQKLESLRSAPEQSRASPCTNFTICCNNCEVTIPDAHWHCSICDRGDFDLCGDCVDKGHLCDHDDHWLIKRFVKDGKVVPSTTESIGPKKTAKLEQEEKVPGAFDSDLKREETRESLDSSRTCNSCVGVFDESNFVTCRVCDDYDLCIPCHVGLKHGHHPSHAFAPASKETQLNVLAHRLCSPGRNERHFAICDGCEEDIYGVRHKCLSCPDFDYCSSCVKESQKTHPGHRLVPIYEPVSMRPQSHQHHIGIFCDGPLCEEKASYIVGDRYKCAVCHDRDFCANCEALPKLVHNRTHPLIKFKTPVRNVSVTTMGEKPNGEHMRTMGDQITQTSSRATETTPAASSANAATQVQTVAETKPTVPVKEEPKVDVAEIVAAPELQALFVRDVIPDGSSMSSSQRFQQAWIMRNPGPHAWPAGCCVCYIGGDSMLDIDPNHPSHVNQINKANKSNVIDRVVEVGEEVIFRVAMRTPERKGKAISYWRLKDATGLPFGHKLWCDIEVRDTEPTVKVEEQVKAEHIEDISKHAKVEDEAKEEEAQRESKMIFPKLDKESPVSSTHEVKTPPAPAGPVSAEDKESLEEVESLELDDESDSDEPFLTDEEYELIGSDDERETAKNGKK